MLDRWQGSWTYAEKGAQEVYELTWAEFGRQQHKKNGGFA